MNLTIIASYLNVKGKLHDRLYFKHIGDTRNYNYSVLLNAVTDNLIDVDTYLDHLTRENSSLSHYWLGMYYGHRNCFPKYEEHMKASKNVFAVAELTMQYVLQHKSPQIHVLDDGLKRKNAMSQYCASLFYPTGKKKLYYLKLSARQNYTSAMDNLAMEYVKKKNYDAAIWLLHKCELTGDRQLCNNLGAAYAYAQNFNKAVHYLTKSKSWDQLAIMYSGEFPSITDLASAITYLKKWLVQKPTDIEYQCKLQRYKTKLMQQPSWEPKDYLFIYDLFLEQNVKNDKIKILLHNEYAKDLSIFIPDLANMIISYLIQ